MSNTDKAAAQDYASLKLPELRKLAAERGLRGVSGLRKGDLITALTTGQVPAKAAKAAKAAKPVADAAPADAAAKQESAADAAESKNAGANPRRVRKATRKAGAAHDHAAHDHADNDNSANFANAANAAAAEAQNENKGEQKGEQKGDEQRYESRSQARRARRNRARRQERENAENTKSDNDAGNGAANEGSQDSSSEQQGNEDKRENNDRGDRGDRNERNDRNDRGGRNNRRNTDDDDDNNGGRRNRRNRGGNDNNGGGNDLQIREGDEVQAVGGILEVVDNNVAFLRTTGYRAASSDVFVNNNLVRRLGLRSGDALTGKVKVSGPTHTHGNGRNRRKYNQLVQVDTVNGADPSTAQNRPHFSKLTPLYPNQRLRLETDPKILTTRVIDLIMPIGKGQRALIVSPPKAGKTTILQNIANAISANNPECYLMVVLVDERPEEVTDMQRSVKGEVIASTFDRPPSEHTSVAELAIERAKRLVEQGKDVVVLLDSITRLGRAYNNSSPASGRILSGGVDSNALYPPKRFLGAARNIEDGGSLTIIATAMVETGSTGDTVIFEEFKGTGNAELKLDRAISERRIFPAVDVNPSGTRKDELLLVPEEARIMTKLRRILSGLDSFAAIDLLIKQLKKTRSNGEFLMQVASSAPMVADKEAEDYI